MLRLDHVSKHCANLSSLIRLLITYSINATVLGSKNADNTAEKSGENDESSGEVHTGENGNEEEQEDVEN